MYIITDVILNIIIRYVNDETLIMGRNFIAVGSILLPGFIDILDDYYLRHTKVMIWH
jgi:hypothetical protein